MDYRCENCEHGIVWEYGDEGYVCYSCQLEGQSHYYPEICPQDNLPTEQLKKASRV